MPIHAVRGRDNGVTLIEVSRAKRRERPVASTNQRPRALSPFAHSISPKSPSSSAKAVSLSLSTFTSAVAHKATISASNRFRSMCCPVPSIDWTSPFLATVSKEESFEASRADNAPSARSWHAQAGLTLSTRMWRGRRCAMVTRATLSPATAQLKAVAVPADGISRKTLRRGLSCDRHLDR
jgi:hypothetical protein